jgi:TonB family protein
MSTTEIPPKVPSEPGGPVQASPEGDLYDARRWESAYSELHATPALLIQMQDDLSRSRMREAFWISLVVHLLLVITIWQWPDIARLFPTRPTLLVSRNSPMQGKELTYLEMPPDSQKVTKRPDTNIISDKDRIASSKKPHVDPEELRKILDSARSGLPAPPSPPAQTAQPPSPPAAQPPARQPAQGAPPPPASSDQVAKLQLPPNPKGVFGTPMSAGSAIEEAARAAAANRGGYAGPSGDYGLGAGRQPTKAIGEMDVLSDTMGVDFGPYLSRVLQNVRTNWYNLIPEVARAPIMKKGKVTIEFVILKDGRIAGLRAVAPSGDVALDRAAWGGITASNPFPPLPSEYGGQYLALRFHFFYNPDSADLQ